MTKLHSLMQDLKKANTQLKKVLKLKPNEVQRDAAIQRFEFTFELCWKTMQEHIRNHGLDCKSPKSCIRTAAQIDLIKNPETWIEYLNSRNSIAHVYNEKLANEVYQEIETFPKVVDQALKQLNSE